jgi:DUF1365 family protein
MNSRVGFATVRHRRRTPVEHAFDYRVFMLLLDLDEVDRVFAGRWLWSARRPAPAWFRRADFLGDRRVPLDEAVRGLVEERTGRRPAGPIRLLTNLRYLGLSFNPVSFYFCFDEAGERVETIVAEITNTPWLERHAYVLDRHDSLEDGARLRFRFRKGFHVSPFLDMDYDYDWSFTVGRDSISIHMQNLRGGVLDFDAGMAMRLRPITGPSLAGALARHPWMSAKIVAAIYLQALKLWWKRCPFFLHPSKRGLPLQQP